ncbi:hypothetical protein [Planctomicrobium piriforme]|uniref:DUF3299 domain-containing protein n=1 Tax=Planctomicrobium piriforme TaxID=1576369 RepID=A0A1I3ENE6_9PLAN|nr:hypothetical protein [Planctomicrobium piriforme]SFI00472.1 hypothetical protein SAMN05421753_104302 [Planctomicrobium piriforme]
MVRLRAFLNSPLAASLAAASICLSGCNSERLDGYHVVEEQPAAVETVDNSPPPETLLTAKSAAETPAMKTTGDKPAVLTEAAPVVNETGVVPASATTLASLTEPAPGRMAPSIGDLGNGPAFKLKEPLPIKLLVPTRDFVAEGSEHALRVTYDDLDLLKVLNMDPVPPNAAEYFPDWLKNLDGKRVVLRGWMYPPSRQDGIASFMFVRDNGLCCFGSKPKIYDKVAVKMRPGTTTHYIQGRPFDVIATLTIAPEIEGDDETLWWMYFLDDAVVVEK